MTENEALKIATHCLGVQAEQEVCEEGPVYIESGIVCKEIARTAISALKEVQQYRKIGTVEECRKAVEKQKAKKCIIDSCSDHAHYKCPSCGQIELSIYKHGFPRLGRITKYCPNCGQAIAENLEGIENECRHKEKQEGM